MINEKLAKMMDDEIESVLEYMGRLDPSCEEYVKACDRLDTLYRIRLDDIKHENDVKMRNDASKDRWIKVGIAGAELIIPMIFYAKWMKTGFMFEKDNTFTSFTFKELIKRFKPTRK